MSKNKILLYVVITLVIVVAVAIAVFYKKSPDTLGVVKYLTQIDESTLNEEQLDYYKRTKEILQSNPDDYQTAVQLGNLFYSLDKYDIAEDIYLKLMPLKESDTLLWQNLAATYKAQGKFQEAADMYYKVLDNNILFMNVYDGLEGLYRYKQLPADDKFPDTLMKARELDVQDQYEKILLKKLAFYYYYQEDTEQALKYFTEYMDKYPDDELIRPVLQELQAK